MVRKSLCVYPICNVSPNGLLEARSVIAVGIESSNLEGVWAVGTITVRPSSSRRGGGAGADRFVAVGSEREREKLGVTMSIYAECYGC